MQSNSDEGCYNLHGEALTNKICAPDHSSLLLSFIHYLPRLYFFVSVMRCTIFCFPFFSSSVSHFYCLSLKSKPHFVFYWKETYNCGKKERYMLFGKTNSLIFSNIFHRALAPFDVKIVKNKFPSFKNLIKRHWHAYGHSKINRKKLKDFGNRSSYPIETAK